MSSGNAGVLFLFCVLRQFVKHQHLQLLLASGGQNMTESWCKEGEIISILCYRINYTRKAPWKRDKFLNTYEGRDLLLMVGYKSTSDWLGYTSIMRQVQCCILHLLLDILNVLCFGLFSWETSLLSLNLNVSGAALIDVQTSHWLWHQLHVEVYNSCGLSWCNLVKVVLVKHAQYRAFYLFKLSNNQLSNILHTTTIQSSICLEFLKKQVLNWVFLSIPPEKILLSLRSKRIKLR